MIWPKTGSTSHAPGHAQCDFGEAMAIVGCVERKVHYFVLDLPHSDGCFVKAYPAETTEAFLDGHVSSFGDNITFNVFHWPPIVDYCRLVAPDITDRVDNWLVNDGQGLSHSDAATLGLKPMQSLADGRFEQAVEQSQEEDYLVQPDLLGNAMGQAELAQKTDMQPASPFELIREHVLQFSLFLGVCGGFRIG